MLGLHALDSEPAPQGRLLRSVLPGATRRGVDEISRMSMSRRLKQAKEPGKEANKKSKSKNVLVDLTASDLDGIWTGTTSPAVALNAFGAPVCPEDSGTCIADVRLRFTYTISGGGTDFKHRIEKDESGSCPLPILAETLVGTVDSFENSRLVVSYTTDGVAVKSTSPLTSKIQAGISLLGPMQTACVGMKVFTEGKVVRADVKITKMFEGNIRAFLEHSQKPTTGFSMCTDDTLACNMDFSNPLEIAFEMQQLVDMECVSGKCLELAE